MFLLPRVTGAVTPIEVDRSRVPAFGSFVISKAPLSEVTESSAKVVPVTVVPGASVEVPVKSP
jgi:hypothetical protein